MGKLRKTVTVAVTSVFLCCMAVFGGAVDSLAAGEAYSVPLEEAYGVIFHSIYDNRLAGSPLEAQIADGVDTATGHLMLSRTDISLEGTGGMDFELNRYYDSNRADLGHTTVECVDELQVDTIKVHYTGMDGEEKYLVVSADIWNNNKDGLKDMLVKYTKGQVHEQTVNHNTQRAKTVNSRGYDVYGIASGWRFDFPWIETVTMSGDEGWGKKPAYLHYGGAGAIKIETEKIDTSKSYSIKGLYGYDYDDIKIEDYDSTVDGIKCRYLMRDKTGLRTYFNEDGVIVLQKDAHDNTIKYTYKDGVYFDKITDSVGREIVFNYRGDGDEMALTSVTVDGSEVSGGVPSKTVTYETEKKTYTPHYGDRVSGVILTGATVDGSIEKYSYKTAEHLVNSAGAGVASQRATTDQCYLLNKIESDGSEKHYEYRACSIRGTKDEAAKLGSNVATEFFYVTGEYEKDAVSGVKSGGIKYDYFQKHDNELLTFADFSEMKNEAWPYGSNGLTSLTVVSSFNPNTYKTNGKYYDYAYTKSDINPDTLKLAKDTKKDVSLYVYNKNKMLVEEVNYGEEKEETLYEYDKDGEGSLVVLETGRSYGSKGTGAVTTKHGYKYDSYRNVVEDIKPQAYKAANADKKHLFTTTYTYNGTDTGYQDGDIPFVCPVLTEEAYISQDTKSRLLSVVAENGIDYKSICEQRSVRQGDAKGNTDFGGMADFKNAGNKSVALENFRNVRAGIAEKAGFAGGVTGFSEFSVLGRSIKADLDGDGYKTISKTDFTYDSHGNETQGKVYPSYGTDGEKEVIENNYEYNSLGQQTKKSVTLTSAKNPSDNRTYTEEEITYDSFGNELSYTDDNGLTTKTSYNSETGEEEETINSVGTEYETKDREYVSEDGLKSMTVDGYGRVSIDIQDAFGNTIVSKDETAGTWTESIYEYGTVTGSSGTGGAGAGNGVSGAVGDTGGNTDGVSGGIIGESTPRLIEERTYSFTPDEKKFMTNENGEQVANFYITGKGEEILSGSKHFYDNLGNEVGSAEFCNGDLDAAHCTSWSFSKSGTEVTGEGDSVQTISTNYSKALNPIKYQSGIADNYNGTSGNAVSADEYYDMFNDAVLSEEITKTVTDATGNTLSQVIASIRGENKTQTSTEYESDDFGRTVKENTVTKKYQDGRWLPSYETETLYSYDGTETQIRQRQRAEKKARQNGRHSQ